MSGKLSPTQLALLDRIWRAQVPLIRFPGGFWAAPGTPTRKDPFAVRGHANDCVPVWHYPTQTIRALIKRELLQEVWSNRYGPTKVALTPAGEEVCDQQARAVGVADLTVHQCHITLE